MNNISSSACILIDSGESQCVAHALKLIGVILNSSNFNSDKRALLICSRSSWEELLESMGEKLGSYFKQNSQPTMCVGNIGLYQDSTENLKNILEKCYESEIKEVLPHTDQYYSINNPDYQTENPHSVITDSDIRAVEKLLSQEREPQQEIKTNMNEDNSEISTDTMKRVLLRFVEDPPSKRIVDDEHSTFPPELSFNPYWNYVQAASEMSTHGNLIEYVVVAGLSEINSKIQFSNYQGTRAASRRQHPFTAIAVLDDKRRVYNNRALYMYAMSLALSLNAIKSRTKILNDIDGNNSDCLPGFFLVETLPPDPEDATKFKRFISNRFSYTYQVNLTKSDV